MNRTLLITAATLVLVSPALAQSNVDPFHKSAWQENTGWLNFRDAGQPAGTQGVRLHGSFFSGFAWGENIGFINFGDGTPVNRISYANATGTDFGVNRNPATGALSGLAWGENVGWINFTLPSLPAAQQPRFDAAGGGGGAGGRLRGYAWGENIGWINLDNTSHFIEFNLCPCDFNSDAFLNSQDFFDFLTEFFGLTPRGDYNTDGFINSQDFFDFLSCLFAGCPA